MTGALRELSGTWRGGFLDASNSSGRRFGFDGVLGTVLAIVGLTLAALGGVALYQRLVTTTPLAVTCREFVQGRPAAAWLRLTGCAVDYLGAGYRDAGGKIVELFLPVRPAGVSPGEPAALVAATRDPAILAIAENGIGGGRQPTQEQFLLMMLKVVTALGASREMTGVVRTGVVEGFRTRRLLSGLTTPLAPGAVLLDLNERPGLLAPAVQTALGVGLVLVAVMRRRRVARPAVRTEAAAVAEPAPGAAPSAPQWLRGLLIVNLDPDGGIEGLEHAPPLGRRDEVVERITKAIDGIQFDARGRGRVRWGGEAVIVDIGSTDPVPCAVAGADGETGAIAVRRLLSETGWRAYVPASGQLW